MRYGIFSDIHSNLEALEAVLEALSREQVDQVLCAGDVVGYGADPSECLSRISQRRIPIVAGNHDWAVAGKLPLDWFNATARVAVEWAGTRLTQAERSALGVLPLVWKDARVTLVHGSLCEPDQFPYLLDAADATLHFRTQETTAAFLGHTHVPAVYLTRASEVRVHAGTKGAIAAGEKGLVNVGSVGQPRDGDPRAAFCLYDSDLGSFEIRRVAYDVEKTQAKIREARLPEFLAERLKTGD